MLSVRGRDVVWRALPTGEPLASAELPYEPERRLQASEHLDRLLLRPAREQALELWTRGATSPPVVRGRSQGLLWSSEIRPEVDRVAIHVTD